MNFIIITFLSICWASAVAQITSNDICTTNMCGQEVQLASTGSAKFERMLHGQDCRRFMQVTVEPITCCQTKTSIVTVISTSQLAKMARRDTGNAQRTPTTLQLTAIPTYARDCIDQAQYWSACSCWGYTPTTITDSGLCSPVTTVTATTTRDVSICPGNQTYCGGANCTDTWTDTSNCGRCGTTCLPLEACIAGICSCSNGVICKDVCIDIKTDYQNCGACGYECPSGSSCEGGVCVCGGTLSMCINQCRDTTSDIFNCGSCGIMCPTDYTCENSYCVTNCEVFPLSVGQFLIYTTQYNYTTFPSVYSSQDQTTSPGLSFCAISFACANFATKQGSNAFDLHRSRQSGTWSCWTSATSPYGGFYIYDDDALAAFGFSFISA